MPNINERLKKLEALATEQGEKIETLTTDLAASQAVAEQLSEQLAEAENVAEAAAAAKVEAEAQVAAARAAAEASAAEAADAKEKATEFDKKVAAAAIEITGAEPAVTDGGGAQMEDKLTPEQATEQLASITDLHKKAAFIQKHKAALLAAAAG